MSINICRIDCKFAKRWDCTLKPKKFLIWSYFGQCTNIHGNTVCNDQMFHPKPIHPPKG